MESDPLRLINKAELARLLNISGQAIGQWRLRGIPAERVVDLEAATGIPREWWRPDLYLNLKEEG